MWFQVSKNYLNPSFNIDAKFKYRANDQYLVKSLNSIKFISNHKQTFW